MRVRREQVRVGDGRRDQGSEPIERLEAARRSGRFVAGFGPPDGAPAAAAVVEEGGEHRLARARVDVDEVGDGLGAVEEEHPVWEDVVGLLLLGGGGCVLW